MYIYEYKNNGAYLQTFKEDCEGKPIFLKICWTKCFDKHYALEL